jgi:hypothetical protein
MRIALIGDRESGKTSFFGALHALYRARQARRAITQPEDLALLNRHAVSRQIDFWIQGYRLEGDRKTLDRIAQGLRKNPIDWPMATRISDYFDMNVSFEHSPVGGGDRITREKQLTMLDFPGEHFRSYMDHNDDAQTSRSKAGQSDAIIFFIDTGDAKRIESRLSEVAGSIREIIGNAAAALSQHRAFLPVTVVLSKCDAYGSSAPGRKHVHATLFKEIVAQFSNLDARIMLMSCPTTLIATRPNTLNPANLEYPFLFSALGIIMAQHYDSLDDATSARELRSESLFKRFLQFLNDPRTIGSMERGAKADLGLAKAIISGIKADLLLDRADLRFAQVGSEIDLSQLEATL